AESPYDLSASFNLTPQDMREFKSLSLNKGVTHKQLSESELKTVIEYLNVLDSRLNLYDLEYNVSENEFIGEQMKKLCESKQKHLKQISSITGQMELILNELEAESCRAAGEQAKR